METLRPRGAVMCVVHRTRTQTPRAETWALQHPRREIPYPDAPPRHTRLRLHFGQNILRSRWTLWFERGGLGVTNAGKGPQAAAWGRGGCGRLGRSRSPWTSCRIQDRA